MKNYTFKITLRLVFCILILSSFAEAQIKGWGTNGTGQLGLGSFADPNPTPVTITAVPDATGFGGQDVHTLFLKADGTVLASGYNGVGELGNGTFDTTTNQNFVSPVLNLTNVIQVKAGFVHSVALRSDGTVWSWGHNNVGQLGIGANSTNSCECSTVPVQTLISNVVQIDSGSDYAIALKADGTVWAWGFNGHGQIGDGTSGFGTNRPTPVQVGVGVAGFNNIIAVSAGNFHAAALKSDGTVWTWGDNLTGIVGNGAAGGLQRSPVQNTTMTNVMQIAAGSAHVSALKTDGTIWTWGSNLAAEAGNGTFDNQGCQCLTTPQQNTTMTDVITLKSVGATILTRVRGGSIWAWGLNNAGQVGDGTIGPNTGCNCRLTPSQTLVGAGNAVMGSGRSYNFAGKPSFETPTGAIVRRFGEFVSIAFGNVTASGTTQYSAIDPTATGLIVPANYMIRDRAPAYNVTSTATTSGKNYVCIEVPSEFDRTQFGLLKILHEEGANLVDRTVSGSFMKREICAGATSFGRFVIAQGTTQTPSGPFTVSGRILNSDGRALSKATVVMTDEHGNTRRVLTGGFGYYTFESVNASETITISVSVKSYTFSPQMFAVYEDSTDLNFMPQ